MDYVKIYEQLISRAKTRLLDGYVEVHHIVPKCIGGLDEESNLVALTAREHYFAHTLLVRIYPGNKRLVYALWAMSNQTTSLTNRRDFKISSRTYEHARELFSNALRGRECTWGSLISKSKKGRSTGPRTVESINKQKETVQKNPFKHSEEAKKSIGQKLKAKPKSEETRQAISAKHKLLGTKRPYRGKPFTYQGTTYPSKLAAAKALNLAPHKLKQL